MTGKPKKLILLGEDNPGDALLTAQALEQSGIDHGLVVARDGVEVLEYLFGTGSHQGRDLRVMPSLVLLDHKMPRLDGLEALARIRADERTRFLPVVLLTSSVEPRDVYRSYAAGANSYLRKPLNFERFLMTMRLVGEYWLQVNELPAYYPGPAGSPDPPEDGVRDPTKLEKTRAP